MDPVTIKQLEDWMAAHCYNGSYAIGSTTIHEGYGLGTDGSLFVWYYTERGERHPLNYFQTEQQAVDFAFKKIFDDKSANRHLIGFLNDVAQEKELLMELEARRIPYWKDDIPYGGLHDRRVRVFVFGCDVQKVLDLQEKYSFGYA